MKGSIIKFVKKHRRLYNLAKKINRKINGLYPKKIYSVDRFYYYTYILKELNELPLIKEHYSNIKKLDTKLLIVVDNPNIACKMAKLISENADALFTDLGYYQNYGMNFNMDKVVLLDYRVDNSKLLKLVK